MAGVLMCREGGSGVVTGRGTGGGGSMGWVDKRRKEDRADIKKKNWNYVERR